MEGEGERRGQGVPSTAPRPCVNRAQGLHRGHRHVVPSARNLIHLDQMRFSGDKHPCFLLMQPVSENSSSLLDRIADSWTVPTVFPVSVYERFVWNGHRRKRSLEERGLEKEVTKRRRENEIMKRRQEKEVTKRRQKKEVTNGTGTEERGHERNGNRRKRSRTERGRKREVTNRTGTEERGHEQNGDGRKRSRTEESRKTVSYTHLTLPTMAVV